MAVIGLLLFLIIPLVFLYSLFKPSKLKIRTKKNASGKWTRPQSFLAFSVAWLVSVVMLVQGAETDASDEQIKDNVATAVTDNKEPIVKEPSRKERKAAEKAAKAAEEAKKEEAKEAELVKEDLQRQSTLIGNSSSRPILSNGWSRMDIYTNCQIVLKNQLKSPKSFDSEIRTVKFIRDAEEEIIGVNFDFYATNSFGAELIHSGTCVYDFNGKLLESQGKAK